MRKEFTAVSTLSAILLFTAGMVLCMQVANIKSGAGAAISGPVLWAVEVAVFGATVLGWRPKVSFAGWILGIAVVAVMRIALVSGAGMVLAITRETTNMGPAMSQTSAFLPRMCAAGFALMICYPFRFLLPLREAEIGKGFRDGSAARGNGEDGLLIVTMRDRGGQPAESPRGDARMHSSSGILSSVPLVEGEVELPLSTVLALMPEHLITDRALALGDTETLAIPLEVIVPQLKEARVVFNVTELRSWIPLAVRKALVQPADSDIETENGLVALPLELIIPQLPAEVLELPPPSPPAWAQVDAAERVVFATV